MQKVSLDTIIDQLISVPLSKAGRTIDGVELDRLHDLDLQTATAWRLASSRNFEKSFHCARQISLLKPCGKATYNSVKWVRWWQGKIMQKVSLDTIIDQIISAPLSKARCFTLLTAEAWCLESSRSFE